MQTLLIVDDEVMIADGLHDMLKKAFADRLHVVCAYSSAGALAIAQEMTIDILLTDINMPDCSGLKLHTLIQQLNANCKVIYLTGYSDFEYARKALEQHAFSYVLKGEGDDHVIRTIERALLFDVENIQHSQDEEAFDTSQNWLETLHEYIEKHPDEDLSLNRLAEYCHFHPVYLSRIYKEATGKTISDHINEVRLRKAEHFLLHSRMTVLEISQALGFASDNYFCRWFKKQTGKSPQTFRLKERLGK